MTQTFSRILAIALLSVMFAATGAGVTCFLKTSAVTSHHIQCHPVRVPADLPPDLPTDHRCCASRSASALTTSIFLSRPALQATNHVAIQVPAAIGGGEILPIAPSVGTPPVMLSLRI